MKKNEQTGQFEISFSYFFQEANFEMWMVVTYCIEYLFISY